MAKEVLFQTLQLNGFKYCYVSLTIQLNSFVYTQFNDQIVLFQTIQLSRSIYLNGLNGKRYYLSHW